ncbi:Bug family tripartite tricarboxylate transporter substrate binding protein [Dankookia sp. GCM10030260]|uniref:Bug family tripartite tricarboxylate transporter substrate binding protein n=1 Tax=Dankookia sp. GCM10030260 TaxID=3273390 RepID=UPI0036088796
MLRRTLLGSLLATPALAQGGWPQRGVEIVVPYAAGGPTDRYAREFAPRLSELWGQPAVVANKPGGATAIGTAAAAHAPPDGHTLLLASFGIVTNPLMLRNLPYDPAALAPLCRFALGGAVLYLHPSVPARTLTELVAWAKANPGALRFGSSGMGSSPHISAELFAWATGIEMLHTPYRGSAPALTDLLAGHVNALFDSVTTMRFARDGRLRAMAIAQPRRNANAPEVPTMAEQGLPQVVARTFYGFFCPAAVPAPLRERIAGDLRDIAASEPIQRAIRDDGLEAMAETPAEFAAFLAEQHALWSRVVRERNLSL